MCQTEEARNMKMAEEFNTSWINVLDKSMMEWFKKYAPGFMCLGRKPHPFKMRVTLFFFVQSLFCGDIR